MFLRLAKSATARSLQKETSSPDVAPPHPVVTLVSQISTLLGWQVCIRQSACESEVTTTWWQENSGAFFSKIGHVATVAEEEQKTVTAHWYTTSCLPKVFENLLEWRPKL